DVKTVPEAGDSKVGPRSKAPSDSDIRLQDAAGSGKRRKQEVITEEIDLDAEAARHDAAQKKAPQRPKPGKSSPALPTSSPFELSETDMNLEEPPAKDKPKKKSEVDSSSDFELIPYDASKSPLELGSGDIPLLGDESVSRGDLPAAGQGGASGINLQEPADSGISLEQGGSDEIEFELSAEQSTTPKPAVKKDDDSSSEFELSLDDSPSDPSDS